MLVVGATLLLVVVVDVQAICLSDLRDSIVQDYVCLFVLKADAQKVVATITSIIQAYA